MSRDDMRNTKCTQYADNRGSSLVNEEIHSALSTVTNYRVLFERRDTSGLLTVGASFGVMDDRRVPTGRNV